MKSLQRILNYAKPYRGQAILALILLVAVIGIDLLLPRLIQRLVDEGVSQGDFRAIWTTALAMIGFASLNALMMAGNTILAARVAQSFAADLRSALFRQVQTFSFGNLDDFQTGELMVRLTSDVNMVQTVVLMSLRILTRAPLLMVGSAILLVVTSPRLAAIISVFLPLIVGFIWFFVRKAQPFFLKVQRKLDQLNQVLQENLAGARVVKAFVRGEYEKERFSHVNDELMERTIIIRRLLSLLPPTMTLFISLGLVAVIWFGGKEAISGKLTLGEIIAFTNYLLTTMFPLLLLGMFASFYPQARVSVQRIGEILEAVPEVQDRSGAATVEHAKGRMAFEKICFSYDHGCTEPVLKDIDLVIEPGQTVAILGATGSGKSSLVHLIPRFHDVDEGRITLDGIDVRELTQESLRAQMGIALQEAVLFRGTIRDNIRYGRPDASDEEVVAAAKAAQAHEFIESLAEGYDFQVKQRGANLSGGQKQRIAIARALLVQPKILILDDSTSAVDVETEAQIQAALAESMRGRTVLIVAQRISTALTSDRIVVLDRGRILAQGTHSELLATSPIYQEIYESQLGNGRDYRD
jgi:ATP-binding cassette subfamily B protein